MQSHHFMSTLNRRHLNNRKVLRKSIDGVTRGAVRRLARKGGIKRMSAGVYEETKNVLKVFVEKIVTDAIVYTEYAQRKTISTQDILQSLKRNGKTLYGYGFAERQPTKQKKTSFFQIPTPQYSYVSDEDSVSDEEDVSDEKDVSDEGNEFENSTPNPNSLRQNSNDEELLNDDETSFLNPQTPRTPESYPEPYE